MGIRSFLSKPIAAYIVNQQRRWSLEPGKTQEKQFHVIIRKAADTQFGKDHDFKSIQSYEDFKKQVPIREYEDFAPYINQIIEGKENVLWPGKPEYFAKTSGTTSGTKYIPITCDSIPNHIDCARNAILSYIDETGNSAFLDGKLIFLSGSPVLEEKGGIKTGRLSGIVNHHVPAYLRSNQMPSYATNCIEDWEKKIDKIVEETLPARMTLISGIPPWVQMYFDRLIKKTGKPVKEIFQDFSVFVHGGVNLDPYKGRLYESIGATIDSIETYPTSEGFIAYQDSQFEEGLLIILNSGIFYEFIPLEDYHAEDPPRLSIEEVELDKNYAVIINSNAGLWGYSLGDTVKFISEKPYRLLVTGRVKHFISAFGEHVIGEEVEKAMKKTLEQFPGVEVTEFTVAPQVNPTVGLPLHEWYIEFRRAPSDMELFERILDDNLQSMNSYYFDHVSGSVLRRLKVIKVRPDSFIDYMKSLGKLGGQNKVPRLSNERSIAEKLIKLQTVLAE